MKRDVFRRAHLELPLYPVKDAARLAGVSARTVWSWERLADARRVITHRDAGAALSYLQLVELRFVAAMRHAGIKLEKIRVARQYLAKRLGPFPFARARLMHDGQDLLQDFDSKSKDGVAKLLVVSQAGQLAWRPILGERFKEFEYDEFAVRWRPSAAHQQILVDPEVAFGAPSVRGVPTWAIAERKAAGESVAEIAEDFAIADADVLAALDFERAPSKQSTWPTH